MLGNRERIHAPPPLPACLSQPGSLPREAVLFLERPGCRLKMASGAHFPLPGQASGGGLPRYEELKDEHDMAIIDPAGASPGSTVIHMHNQSQVYVVPPRDHILWSICTMMYCNFCCLGFMALVFSVKARDRKVVGDHSGARSYGSTAQCLNITAVTLCIVPIVIVIILLATGVFNTSFHNGY